MSTAIRKAGPADYDAMLPLFVAFYREEGFGDAVAGLAANLRQILERADTAAFIAEDDGEAVGAAALSTSFGLEVGFYCELEDLYVLPARRGEGVARALIDEVCAWAEAAGCHDVEIVVTEHGREAAGLVPFYERLGFENSGRLIMERVL